MKVNPDRIDLADSFPLPGPLSVVMESTSRCNFACTFCPTSRLEDMKRVHLRRQDMPRTVWYEVKRSMAAFPKLKQWHFHYDGEPTEHPHLATMVSEAAQCNLAEDYMIRTNGSTLMNPGMVEDLVSCGLTRIGISVEAVNDDGYHKLTRSKPGTFERVVEGVRKLYEHSRGKVFIYAKIIDFGLADTDTQKFHEIFDGITDVAAVEYPMQWNNGVRDSTFGIGVQRTVNGDNNFEHVACPYPLYTMGISSRGEVNACCFDWSWQTTFGNVHEQTLQEIWNGNKRREFLRMHLEGNRHLNDACRDCTAHYACPDTVDDRREELLERLDMLETNGRA